MKVLLAGGAGFLGGHLAEALLACSWRVETVDDLSRKRRASLYSPGPDVAPQAMHRLDLTVPNSTEILGDDFDVIINFAAIVGVSHVVAAGADTFDTNYRIHAELIRLAKRQKKLSRFLFASTSEVYGSPTQHPQTEDYWGNVNPIGPRSCYDEGKRCAETGCRA